MRVFAGQHLNAQRDADGAILVRWDTPNSAVNQPCEDFLAEWFLLLHKLEQWPRLTLVILASGKKGSFGKGWTSSDLERIGKDQRLETITQTWDAILNRWEKLPCPTLATLAGPCIDEAMDMALACDYRVAYQSGAAQFGWTSSFRGWSPPPSTHRRLLCQTGIERYVRLVILGQTLNANEGCDWGLVNISAKGEDGLRNAINRMRQKAFLRGKINRREPVAWGGRVANRSEFIRFWIKRGMKRVLDRITSLEHPVIAHAWGILDRSIRDPDWNDPEGTKAITDFAQDRGGFWIRAARSSFQNSQLSLQFQNIKKIILLGESSIEFEIARKALLEKIPVVVGAQSAEKLGRRVMRLGSEANVPPSAALKMIDGKILADLFKYTPSKQDIILGLPNSSGEDWTGWSQLGALLMLDAKSCVSSKELAIRSLVGKHRSGWIEFSRPDSSCSAWLESMGFRIIQSGSLNSIWRIAGAWWAETLRAMAEGLNPFVIEQEARRFGFLQGPLADLCRNANNLVWVEKLVSPEDAGLLTRWRDQFVEPNRDLAEQANVMGWWQARRWRKHSGVKLSPVLMAMPTSARVAALVSRWIATIVLSCDREDLKGSIGLSSLEARVGWPVFRGSPLDALNTFGETVDSVGIRLSSAFGERFIALAGSFRQDNP